MNEQNTKLVEPTIDLKNAFLSMAEEFRAAGDDRFRLALEDFAAYLEQLKNHERGEDLPSGRVPQNLFWLVKDARIIGAGTLRHHLNQELEKEGGHVGYSVRPSERRKGFGTLILKLTLEKAKERGLKRVLVTCDTDNAGSAKIIEKNGGVLAGHDISERTGKQISRYQIEI